MDTQTGILYTCADNRLARDSEQVEMRLKEMLHLDTIFEIKLAGPEGQWIKNESAADLVSENMQLLIDAKHAGVVIVMGHCDCAGHNVSDQEHEDDTKKCAMAIASKLTFEGEVIPVLARLSGEGSKYIFDFDDLRSQG